MNPRLFFFLIPLLASAFSCFGATITGNLQDLTGSALDTDLYFRSMNPPGASGVYVVVPSSKKVTTSAGAFTVTLLQGYYQISSDRLNGYISVPGGTSSYNIKDVWSQFTAFLGTNQYNLAINAITNLTGDVTAAGPGSAAATVTGVNGVAVSGSASNGKVLTATGSATATWQTPSAGVGTVQTINTLSGTNQTFTTGTTGSDFAIVSSGTNHAFNLPTASASNRGALSSADWTTFNGKVAKAGDTMSGTLSVTGLTNTALTASRLVVSGSDKSLTSSSATSTEAGYLSGVTSAIQTQIDSKVAKAGDTMSGALLVPTLTAGSLVTTNFTRSGVTNFTAGASSFDAGGPGTAIWTNSSSTAVTILNLPTSTSQSQKFRLSAKGDGVSTVSFSSSTHTIINRNTAITTPANGAWVDYDFEQFGTLLFCYHFADGSHTHAASDITSGQLALARGGTASDLSATGAANSFLKQSSAGAAITVGTISDADVPDTITASLYLPLAGGTVSGGLLLSTTNVAGALAGKQPLDATLTTLSGKSTTGSGAIVLQTSPTLVTPDLGAATASSVTMGSTNVTGALANKQPLDATLTTLSGKSTTGSGAITLQTSPVLVTPDLGAATGTSVTLGGTNLVGALAGKQPLDSDLTALAAVAGNGLWAVTGAGTGSPRTITGTANQITVSNGDGVSGNPTLSTPQNIATNSTVTFNDIKLWGGPWIDVRTYGADVTGASDSSTAIQNAINAAPSTGAVIFAPAGIYLISSTLNILDKPNVRFVGIGAAQSIYGSAPTTGTVLKWNGATNIPMMKVGTTTSSTSSVFGNGVVGVAFDANGKADTGLKIISSWYGVFTDLHFYEFRTTGLEITTVDLTSTPEDTQGCDFGNISVRAASSWADTGVGISCTSAAVGVGNTSQNLFRNIHIYHKNGTGLNMGDSDSNTFIQLALNRVGGATGVGIVLNGSGTLSQGHCRDNSFFYVQSVGGLTAKATALTQAAVNNYVLWSYGNSSPAPTIESGASLYGLSTRGGIPVNNVALRSRNAASSGEVDLIKLNTLDEVEIPNTWRLNASGTLANGANISLSTSTGSKIGTGTTQKLGFFNAAPVAQQSSTTDLKAGLVNLGFFATGGATPLDLNGGTLVSPLHQAADVTGTDQNGTNVKLRGGVGTGTGRAGSITLTTGNTTTTGSTAQNESTRVFHSAKFVNLTEASATLFANIALASGKYLGARLNCTVNADDGTDFQSLNSMISFGAVNKAGTVTVGAVTTTSDTAAVSAGTLTCTYTAVANGNGVDIKANATSSLTQTTLRVKWSIISLNTDDVGTVTAQ